MKGIHSTKDDEKRGYFNSVIKRDGRIVDFDPEKIVNAIWKALKATGKDD